MNLKDSNYNLKWINNVQKKTLKVQRTKISEKGEFWGDRQENSIKKLKTDFKFKK